MLDFLQRGIANHGADRAADAIEAGNQQGIDAINGFYNQSRGDLSPYLQGGQFGVNGLQALLSGDNSGWERSGDFLAARDAGLYALDHGAAARGRLYSGGYDMDRAKGLADISAGYLGNYRSALGGLAQLGQNSAMGLGQLGAQAGGNIASLYSDSGAARAGYHSAYANNTNNMWGNIFQNAGSLFGLGG